ncbi:MAG: hypothetical protein JSW54_07980, partial [Fidelibacterota bacterium]
MSRLHLKRVVKVLLILASGLAAQHSVGAGFRGSMISGHSPAYLIAVTDSMVNSLDSPAVPAALWILSFYTGRGYSSVRFPLEEDLAYCKYTDSDQSQRFLDAFDAAGIKVWLQ